MKIVLYFDLSHWRQDYLYSFSDHQRVLFVWNGSCWDRDFAFTNAWKTNDQIHNDPYSRMIGWRQRFCDRIANHTISDSFTFTSKYNEEIETETFFVPPVTGEWSFEYQQQQFSTCTIQFAPVKLRFS